MQVDSELDWENNSDDTSDRRSPSPYQKRLKGFSEGTPSRQELTWWINNATLKNGLPILYKQPSSDIAIHVDALDPGWGISSLSVQTAGCWTKKEKEDSINGRELKAISFAIQLHMSRHKNSTTKIYSDNRTALKYLNKAGGTSSMLLQNLATQIQGLYNKSNIQSTEATSIRMVLTNEIIQISPIRVKPSEMQDNRICSETQQEIEEVLEFFPDPEAQALDAFNQWWP
ncbi:hypothetical protein G6F37_000738 [Rhizopus arrhizus]|nr:hypothetical protein G6F38_000960 [Rhizopus arrhizus]KAG1163954.1 hypothetical protein G6F37_000738 [Rhizopus arrhizus]